MSERLSRYFPLLVFFWTAGLCWFYNHNTSGFDTWDKIAQMNDVPFILQGYKAVPNPLVQGWVWWYGPWIEQTVRVFRPLASYLLWINCWLGEHGFTPVIFAIGFTLYLAASLLGTALAWRLTQSRLCMLLAGYLASQVLVWNIGQERYWLFWFPAHHDLLFIALLLGALLFLDLWLENPRRSYLIGTWTCFVLSVLTKEYGYIYPLLAAVLVGTRFPQARKRGWKLVGLAFVFVLVMFAYRMWVLPHPYNPPPFKKVHFLRRPFLYWFYPFYRHVLTEVFWVPGLALTLITVILGSIHWYRSEVGKRLSKIPFGFMLPVILGLAVLGIYLQLAMGSIMNAIWYFFDWSNRSTRLGELGGMMFLLYVLFLIGKYRKVEHGIAALLMLMFIYGPVWTYLGWHYTLAGWFIRCGIWWPIVAKLVWRDVQTFVPEKLVRKFG